jgi:hypothetical protein
MPAAIATAIAFFEMVLFRENNQSIVTPVIMQVLSQIFHLAIIFPSTPRLSLYFRDQPVVQNGDNESGYYRQYRVIRNGF